MGNVDNHDVMQYAKVMIDPVLVYGYAGLDKEEMENHQKLANNDFVYVT